MSETKRPSAVIWAHKSKFKGRVFFGNYEWNRGGKRILKFKDCSTGREVGPFKSHEAAKKDGWKKVG